MLSKKIRKFVCLLIAVIMVLSFSACGTKEENKVSETAVQTNTDSTTAAEETKPAELAHKNIKVMLYDEGQSKWSDPNLHIMKVLAEAGNMTFDIMAIPAADYATKLKTVIAGGDIPDLSCTMLDVNELKVFGQKGLFVSVDQYFDKMPNFKAMADKYSYYYKMAKAEDGHIYGFPFILDADKNFWAGLCIRGDIVKQGGMDIKDIKTMDDLYNALKIIKDIKGNSPWVDRYQAGWVNAKAAPMFGTDCYVYYNDEEQKYKVGPFEENFRLMLEFLNKCYKDKIIHPDIFTYTDQMMEQSILNDKAYFYIDNMMTPPQWTPKGVETMSYILPPEVNGKRYYAQRPPTTVSTWQYWTISSKSDAIDNIIKAIDWGYSPEGIESMNWGIEGETFTRDADGARRITFKVDPNIKDDTEANAVNRVMLEYA